MCYNKNWEVIKLKPKDILKALRQTHGYTIQEVSKGTGMTYTMCREYETGDRNLGLQAVLKFADFYHVSTDYLLCREPATPMNQLENMKLTKEMEETASKNYEKLSSQDKAIINRIIEAFIDSHDDAPEKEIYIKVTTIEKSTEKKIDENVDTT